MILDVVRWREHGDGCNRCGSLASHYVAPYWRPAGQRACPACCRELGRLYDGTEWPQEGRHDI